MIQNNPFVVEGYVSPKYFCDREEETAFLKSQISNGCNVALIAPRRMGKSGLIMNLFYQQEVNNTYNTFYVDIYETKNMNEFVYELGKCILTHLKSQGRKAWESFLDILHSLSHSITFNSQGIPIWNVKIGEITHPDTTLDEIFHYLSIAERPSIVAIDEFQVIASYPEKTVEAALRKRIQQCHNAKFIYSGSQRHMMSQIFASPSRPFYNSCTIMGLEAISQDKYLEFVNRHLATKAKGISKEAFSYLYEKFDGITWYIQYVLNTIFSFISNESVLEKSDVDTAITEILKRNSFAYSSLMFQFTSKQKQLLYALAEEDHIKEIMSKDFLMKYGLSASTIQTAVKYLLSHDYITRSEDGQYRIYDYFFLLWIRSNRNE